MGYVAGSFVFGQQPTAAQWNVLWANDASFNNGSGIANLEIGGVTAVKLDYKFSVYRNGAWTSASGSLIVVPFDTKTFDTGSNVDVATNQGRFTAPIAGFYYFSTTVFASLTSGTGISVAVFKNGSEVERLYTTIVSATQNYASGGSTLLQLSANDYIEIAFSGNGGAGITGASNTFFTGFLVSAS
jgi:hypothetical protein